MAALFGSLPAVGRLVLGTWGFQGASAAALICALAGLYLRILSLRRWKVVPDPASLLDNAIHLASAGRAPEAIALVNEAIHTTPKLWQAYQLRGELYVRETNRLEDALRDFDEAIRLAPGEPHLRFLRGHVHNLLGDEAAARRDFEAAGAMASGPDPNT
jgi:tetratricopeptide (TPR) repeat protein